MTKEIPLTQGRVVLVDDDDFGWLSQRRWYCLWLRHDYPYAACYSHKAKKTTLMHRVIMNAPPDLCVDHRDGNTLNNTRSNLRLATRLENLRNQRRVGHKGVEQTSAHRWRARIVIDGRHIGLGSFDTEEAAARAYDAAAKEYFGEFACFNFPEEPS